MKLKILFFEIKTPSEARYTQQFKKWFAKNFNYYSCILSSSLILTLRVFYKKLFENSKRMRFAVYTVFLFWIVILWEFIEFNWLSNLWIINFVVWSMNYLLCWNIRNNIMTSIYWNLSVNFLISFLNSCVWKRNLLFEYILFDDYRSWRMVEMKKIILKWWIYFLILARLLNHRKFLKWYTLS